MITKEVSDLSNIDFAKGEAVLIDKETGMTSFRVVNAIRKITGVKKVGHAGTLDPAASGLLIICTGGKTKEIYKYQESIKVYSGIICLGFVSDTLDIEGTLMQVKPLIDIADNQIFSAAEKFTGVIEQIPPMHSAVKHKGKSLYKYARKGIVVERKARKVNIEEFKITKINLPDVHFKIVCSKGTYIRVIADDFGKELGCGAYLKNLRRDAIGQWNVDDAVTLSDFEKRFQNVPI